MVGERKKVGVKKMVGVQRMEGVQKTIQENCKWYESTEHGCRYKG